MRNFQLRFQSKNFFNYFHKNLQLQFTRSLSLYIKQTLTILQQKKSTWRYEINLLRDNPSQPPSSAVNTSIKAQNIAICQSSLIHIDMFVYIRSIDIFVGLERHFSPLLLHSDDDTEIDRDLGFKCDFTTFGMSA